MQLQIIGIAEDLLDRTPLDEIYQPGAFGEPRAEDRVREIGGGFSERRNGEFAGQFTGAEALYLQENEPHPMAFFSAAPQFGADFVVNRVLGIDKSLKIVRIAHMVLRTLTPAKGVSTGGRSALS